MELRIKENKVTFNWNVPCRFINDKNSIPLTTRNSKRKMLFEYGATNKITDKELKLKSRRNSK